MDADKAWADYAKGILKAEIKRRNLTYADLSERLRAIGVVEEVPNIRNKISRGKYSAVFLFQCLKAIDCKTLHLE